jgi:hypothetical protein
MYRSTAESMRGQPRLRSFHQLNSALSVQPPVLVPAAGEVRVLVVEWPPLVEVLRFDPPVLRDDVPVPVELLRDWLVRCDVFAVADWAEELPVDRLLLDRPLPEELLLDWPLRELLPDRFRPVRVDPVERLVDCELVAALLDRLVELPESPSSLEWCPQMSPEGKPPMRFAT